MIRLLVITTIPDTLRAFILPFVKYWRTQGFLVDGMANGIATDRECRDLFDRVWEVNWSRNFWKVENLTIAPYEIQTVIAREKYDIVHVHTPVASFVTRYALKNIPKKSKPIIIYTAHGFHFFRGGSVLKNIFFLSLEKLAGKWTDYLVVINREDEDAVKRFKIIESNKLVYMPGIGVDTNFYNPDSISEKTVLKIRSELKLTPENHIFLMVAEFVPRKRHKDILKAFAELKSSTAHLVFAGSGSLMQEMQQLAYRLGVQERVHFLGFCKDVRSLMLASTATVLPSEQEGLPRSVMESLCLEIPVIGTDIRGIKDLLKQGRGLLVQVGDIKGLTQAMTWVLENPQEAKVMAKNAQKYITVRHSQKNIISQHQHLYTEVLKRSKNLLDPSSKINLY